MKFDEIMPAIRAKEKAWYCDREYIILSVRLSPTRSENDDEFWDYSLELLTEDMRGCITVPMAFVKLSKDVDPAIKENAEKKIK